MHMFKKSRYKFILLVHADEIKPKILFAMVYCDHQFGMELLQVMRCPSDLHGKELNLFKQMCG